MVHSHSASNAALSVPLWMPLSPGAAVVCSFSQTVVVDSKSRFSSIYYFEQLIIGEMDTILEKKVSIQPGILSSPIGQMSE